MNSSVKKSALENAVEALKAGRMIVLLEENRENEGDLLLAAEWVTPAAVNFMITHARGLVCLALDPQRIDELDLPLMVPAEKLSDRAAFTISIDSREGIESGTSAEDRARTIRMVADPSKKAVDFISPGHVFPLRAREGGVLERPGHTEGAIDLMRIAGLRPAAVLCEILSANGSMARGQALFDYAEAHAIPLLTLRDIIEHRLVTEGLPRPFSLENVLRRTKS